MVHGERDTMIPVAASQALRRCLPGPSKLWVVPLAKHNQALSTAPDEYRRRLLRFFRLHLAPRRSKPSAADAALGPSTNGVGHLPNGAQPRTHATAK